METDPKYEPLVGYIEDIAREIAREEVASLSGLILKRLQEEAQGFVDPTGAMVDIRLLERLFGEALSDFSGHTGEGDAPGT